MFRIGKRFTFDAAHDIQQAVADDNCLPGLHGHTYEVEVVLSAERLTHPGFVADFAILDPFSRHLTEHLDHQHLNDVLDETPTIEAVRRYLHQRWDRCGRLPADRVTVNAVSVRMPAPRTDPPLADHEVRFEAAHRLPGLRPGHKCAQVHGHSYLAGLMLTGASGLGEPAAAAVSDYIASAFHGRYLNDTVPAAGPPTSENLARHLFEWATKQLPLPPDVAVGGARVSETRSTWAEYRAWPW